MADCQRRFTRDVCLRHSPRAKCGVQRFRGMTCEVLGPRFLCTRCQTTDHLSKLKTASTAWWTKLPRVLHQHIPVDTDKAHQYHVFPSSGGVWGESAAFLSARCLQQRTLFSALIPSQSSKLQTVSSTRPFSNEAPSLLRQPPVSDLTIEELATATPPSMTHDQKVVFDLALEGASLFIGGEAGTGKSFLLSAIASALTKKGLCVVVTASTGIAALNIGGNTLHSAFGIPLSTPDDSVDEPLPRSRDGSGSSCSTRRRAVKSTIDDEEGDGLETNNIGNENNLCFTEAQSRPFSLVLREPQRLQFRNTAALAAADVIMWDEVSMLHAGFLEALERALRRTSGRDAHRPFGGAQLILSGDFMQLTPLVSQNTPIGSARRASHVCLGANASKADRKVCNGIQKPLSEKATADLKPVTEKPTAAQRKANKPKDANLCVCSGTPVASKQNGKGQQLWQLPSRKKEVWYYDKPMFESWCFKKHLLHVQLREPQRQTDVSFAADLNQLRRGELPYRLSRSAYLNPVDNTAVRLLPTKAAVKNYNDRRMLELNGESHVFRTQLSLMEATSSTSPMQRKWETNEVRSCRATLLVQYRLCTPWKGNRDMPFSKKGLILSQELRQTEQLLEKRCKLPAHSVRLRALPVRLSSSTLLSTLILECVAKTEKAAEAIRAAVQASLEAPMLHLKTESDSLNKLVRTKRISAPSNALSLFPREIVRLEPIEWPQLLRRLQPAMHDNFRRAIRKDTMLQDKTLKLGCRVMLLRNLSTTYVNGSLGTIVGFTPATDCAHLIPPDLKATTAGQLSLQPITLVLSDIKIPARDEGEVLPIVRMDADGKEVAIPWIVFPVQVVHNDWCYVLRATCVPLTPAYAFTVHKIQGLTLDHSVLFDAEGMFPCDHLVYVAASRVRKFEQLRIINLTPGMISVHVPSLNFTNTIPSVGSARKTWDAWRQQPNSSTSLFLPSYVTKPEGLTEMTPTCEGPVA